MRTLVFDSSKFASTSELLGGEGDDAKNNNNTRAVTRTKGSPLTDREKRLLDSGKAAGRRRNNDSFFSHVSDTSFGTDGNRSVPRMPVDHNTESEGGLTRSLESGGHDVGRFAGGSVGGGGVSGNDHRLLGGS